MAKKWRNRSMTFSLSGFEELWEACVDAGKKAEVEGRKCFEHCAEVMYDELYNKAKQAGLDERLIEEMSDRMVEQYEAWQYEVGWKKQKASVGNPLPDTYKVMFYNYGTPSVRKTKAGANRGKIDPHPAGSHGFIKKAKLAARRKTKKIQQETLNKILEGLK